MQCSKELKSNFSHFKQIFLVVLEEFSILVLLKLFLILVLLFPLTVTFRALHFPTLLADLMHTAKITTPKNDIEKKGTKSRTKLTIYLRLVCGTP